MDKPLYLDAQLEKRERAGQTRLFRWLKAFFPRLAYFEPRPGRRSLEVLLRERSRFSAEAWSEYGPLTEVVAILDIIRKELSLPGHNFIPDDSLVLIMNSSDDLDDLYAFGELETRYGVKYSNEDFQRMKNEDWTLGRFVGDLLDRGKTPGSDVRP